MSVAEEVGADVANLSATSTMSAMSAPPAFQKSSQGTSSSISHIAGIKSLASRPGHKKEASSASAAFSVQRTNSPPNILSPEQVTDDESDDASIQAPRVSNQQRSQAQSQGRNTVARNELISKTGREFGPDIALKVGPNIVDTKIVGDDIIKGIINKESSITEVLNILAFLLNNDEERKNKNSVITDFSYDDGKNSFTDVYKSLTESTAPFDITTLTTATSVNPTGNKITIPGTILKRDERYDLKNDIILNLDQIQPLITACILQMVNILENTRQVFGGWAKLFKGMQGGSNSKSKTKTRRNNRRRH